MIQHQLKGLQLFNFNYQVNNHLHVTYPQVGGVEVTQPVPEYLGESSSGTMGDRAPMQGDITHLYVEAGAVVEKGDPLLALESMKMEVRNQRCSPLTVIC